MSYNFKVSVHSTADTVTLLMHEGDTSVKLAELAVGEIGMGQAMMIADAMAIIWNGTREVHTAFSDLRARLAETNEILAATESNIRTEVKISRDQDSAHRFSQVPELLSTQFERNAVAIKAFDDLAL